MVKTRTGGPATPPVTSQVRPEYAVLSPGSLDLASFAADIVPNPDEIIVSQGGELKTYAKLLRDDQVHSLLQQRQDALVAAEWEVVPGGPDSRDAAAADFVREQVSSLSFDAVSRKMHKGVLYGYSVAECLWALDGATITLAAIRVRKPWRFGFGKEGDLYLRVNAETRLMPERKFWVATWGADDDDTPYGLGLGYNLWWPVYLKRHGAKFWGAYLDKFGSPSTRAKYPSGATEEEKRTALEAAHALRSESAVAMPQGFEVELIEAAKNSGGSYEEFLRYWDDAIAKIILSQTGTTKQGQYSGTAEVLEGVKAELVKADADLLCESFNAGPVTWLTEWNFPGAKPPKVWRKVDNARRMLAELDRDKKTYDLGLELADEEITRRYGDAWKRRTASVVPTVPAISNPPADPDFAEGDGPEHLDRRSRAPWRADSAGAVRSELVSDRMEAAPERIEDQLETVTNAASTSMIDAIRAELDAAMATGEGFAGFSERIAALYPLRDAAAIAEALEGALLTANLAGRTDNG